MHVRNEDLNTVLRQLGVNAADVDTEYEHDNGPCLAIEFENQAAIYKFWSDLPTAVAGRLNVAELFASVETDDLSLIFPTIQVTGGNAHATRPANADVVSAEAFASLTTRVTQLERLAERHLGVRL